MRKILFILFLSAFSFLSASNKNEEQGSDSTYQGPVENRWYYGGTIGFSFWGDYFYLSVNPLVGYKISEKVSIGAKFQYAYINEDTEFAELTSHNYGASIFTRFRPIQQAYLHAEFAYASIEDHTVFYNPINRTTRVESERNWVPFLFLGGGYIQRISPTTSVYMEILFDVIQSDDSPFADWDPIVSVGVGVGF